MTMPFLLLAMLAGIVANVAQVGPLFTTKSLSPKFDKLNPVNGFKNIFSVRSVVELIKNILKIVILGYIAYLVVKDFKYQILQVGEAENIYAILKVFGDLIFQYVLKAGIAFLILASADYLYQRLKFLKNVLSGSERRVQKLRRRSAR
jgi:flagellar biosynthesis protein FlhB